MRNIFIVAAKIMGLYQFCNAFQKFPFTAILFWKQEPLVMLFQDIVSPLFIMALACVLVFKTAWLADKVGLAENTESPATNRDDLLAVGVKLIGLYFAITLFSGIILTVVQITLGCTYGGGFSSILWSLSSFTLAVTLILAVLFIFRTHSMVTMLTLAESAPWRKVVLATLAVLLVICVLITTSYSTMTMRHQLQFPYAPPALPYKIP